MPNEKEQWQRNVREGFVRRNVLKSVHHVVSQFSLLPCDLKHTPFFYTKISSNVPNSRSIVVCLIPLVDFFLFLGDISGFVPILFLQDGVVNRMPTSQPGGPSVPVLLNLSFELPWHGWPFWQLYYCLYSLEVIRGYSLIT